MIWPWLPFRRRGPRIVPVAEFPTPERADEAWQRLSEAGIPAGIVSDPGVLGRVPVTRIEVEEPHVEEAQRLIADLV